MFFSNVSILCLLFCFHSDVLYKYIDTKTFLDFRSISKEEQLRTKSEWSSYCKKVKKEWGPTKDSPMKLRFKRDSKGQCRVQCGITKRSIDTYWKYNLINK